MPRVRVGRKVGTYGKVITNIKKTVKQVLEDIFSYDFILEKIKVAPAVLEFSTEEAEASTRHLQIMNRLAHIQQSLPCIVISEISGDFGHGQLGSGPAETWIDPDSDKRYNVHSIFCPELSLTLDLFAEDVDTRDMLGDALTSGIVTYLKDINYTVNKVTSTGRYTVVINPTFTRTPGSDMPRAEDPSVFITTESVGLTLIYEDFVFIEAPPAEVWEDAEDKGQGAAFTPYVREEGMLGTISTNLPGKLYTGTPFQVRVSGGSGFYQFWSSDSTVANVDAQGQLIPGTPGNAAVYIKDVLNDITYRLPVEVSL